MNHSSGVLHEIEINMVEANNDFGRSILTSNRLEGSVNRHETVGGTAKSHYTVANPGTAGTEGSQTEACRWRPVSWVGSGDADFFGGQLTMDLSTGYL